MREKINLEAEYEKRDNASIIKVIGVGGGGGNAVQHMYSEGIKGVDFLICNTDYQALVNTKVPSKLVLGESGLGAGADPKVARDLALGTRDRIIEFIGKETKMLFITAGMGKGTGTGAAPIIAQIAKEMGILTIGVVTYPFDFEGNKRFNLATDGINEMKKYVDSIIIVKNQNIMTYYDDFEWDKAYGLADDVLKNAVKCIAELITVEGYQNIDFNDINAVMRNSGPAMLGLATARGEDRVNNVVENALSCPLLETDVITDAKNFLFFISFGPDNKLKMSELNAITKKFETLKNQNSDIIWGCTEDPSLGDAIKLSVIITNFIPKEKPKTHIDIDDNIEQKDFTTTPDIEPERNIEKDIDLDSIIDPTKGFTQPNKPINPGFNDGFPTSENLFDNTIPFNNKPEQQHTPFNSPIFDPEPSNIAPNPPFSQIKTEPIAPKQEFKAPHKPEPILIHNGSDPRYDDNINFNDLISNPPFLKAVQKVQGGNNTTTMEYAQTPEVDDIEALIYGRLAD